MRELVVQTLRVASQVDKEKEGLSQERTLIPTEFGSEFADAPSSETYEALVRGAIGTLPHRSRGRLLRFMETGH